MERQSAVDWLYEELWKQTDFSLPSNILEKAKEIEKQQHGLTWDCALLAMEARSGNFVRAWSDFDEYYNNNSEITEKNG
jgi:hypothetical protein